MSLKTFLLWFFIQATTLPTLFSQTNEQLRANLYGFDNKGNPALLDGNLTMYNVDFSNAVNDYDGLKMNNFGENLGMLRDNKTLVIERRQSIVATDTIFFKMWNMRKVTYKLELVLTGLNKPGLNAVLEDLYLNTRTALDLNGVTPLTFAVSDEAGSSEPGRFRVLFLNPSLLEPVVSFTRVNACQKNINVELEWEVSNQKSTIQYDVETSYDGVNFVKANSVANKNSSNIYQWLDVNPLAGSHYYRIRSLSQNGVFKYSDTASIVTRKAGSGKMYPNPVRAGNSLSIDFNNMEAGDYHLKLVNNFGGIAFSKTINHMAGVSTESLKLNGTMPGIYLLQISKAGKLVFVDKVIVK